MSLHDFRTRNCLRVSFFSFVFFFFSPFLLLFPSILEVNEKLSLSLLKMLTCVCVCVWERERERESVCVCVCVWACRESRKLTLLCQSFVTLLASPQKTTLSFAPGRSQSLPGSSSSGKNHRWPWDAQDLIESRNCHDRQHHWSAKDFFRKPKTKEAPHVHWGMARSVPPSWKSQTLHTSTRGPFVLLEFHEFRLIPRLSFDSGKEKHCAGHQECIRTSYVLLGTSTWVRESVARGRSNVRSRVPWFRLLLRWVARCLSPV